MGSNNRISKCPIPTVLYYISYFDAYEYIIFPHIFISMARVFIVLLGPGPVHLELSGLCILNPNGFHAHSRIYKYPRMFQDNCQNYVRILAVMAPGKLLVCGTNSFKPICREYSVQVSVNDNWTTVIMCFDCPRVWHHGQHNKDN